MTEKTSRSIWLRSLGMTMLNTEDTPLAQAHGYLRKAWNFRKTFIYLIEPGETELKGILTDNGTAAVCPMNGSVYARLAERVLKEDAPVYEAGLLGLPMSCSQAGTFGVLMAETEDTGSDEMKKEAFLSFCEVIYAELMGGMLLSSNAPVMEVEHVCVRYSEDENAKNTVEDISLTIREGELTVIMGRSGCGKSSLLNVIAGLLTPVSGRVLFNGTDICSMSAKEKTAFRRDVLGFVFQNYNLLNELSASENINVAAVISKSSTPADQVLETVGLKDKGDRYPRQMSGGEQQRVSIARALIKKPSLLLCDEPTGALDTENARMVMCILQNIAKEQKIPVVVVTHNPDYAVLADHYILMKDGRIAAEYYRHFPCRAEKVL